MILRGVGCVSRIYLDMDRTQSIISQLQEGLLKEVISGNLKEINASAKAGLLSQLININLGGNVKENKVLQAH